MCVRVFVHTCVFFFSVTYVNFGWLLGCDFLVYFTCVSRSEVCGRPYRLLTEPFKIERPPFENLCTICSVEMIKFALQNIKSLEVL